MCGIAAYIGSDARNHTEAVEKMLAAARHRGPDGSGVCTEGSVVLGHLRLAVLDLSDSGAQPMLRSHLAITFNGEIYNYVEIRNALEGRGHVFTSGTDTEVILASYLQWGAGCVDRFDGMWAFVVHDRRANVAFCSRDRFGEKPLHYSRDAERVVLASEPKQLRAIGIGGAANLDSALSFLALDTCLDTRETFYSGIESLQPGHNMTIDLASLSMKIERYYQPGISRDFAGISPSDVPEVFRDTFATSVLRRLRSDVPVGMLLSGGIDSSLIASVAGPAYYGASGKRLVAITSSTGSAVNDESRFAKSVAHSHELEWVSVATDVESTRRFQLEATVTQDRPIRSTSVVAQWAVMKQARESGVTVLLDGQGADETWLGYSRYAIAAAREVPLGERIQFIEAARRKAGIGMGSWLAHSAYFALPSVAAARNSRRMRSLGVEASYRWCLEGVSQSISSTRHRLRELQAQELQDDHLGSLLNYEDRNSMAFSLESRLPFLSRELVELSLQVPVQTMYHDGWTKWPLRRQLAESVDGTVAWRRRKIGFEGHPEAFDPTNPAVLELTMNSNLLDALGVRGPIPAQLPERLAWRLFALALWEDACAVGLA